MLTRFGDYVKPKYVGMIDRRMLDQYVAKRLKDRGRNPGDKIAAATVRKDLRTIRAALAVAHEWSFLGVVPSLPDVPGFESDKLFVTSEHFEALHKTLDTTPDAVKHPRSKKAAFEPADWWKALIATLWLSGMRIGAALALRWEDVDLDTGWIMSRARNNKSKKDQRVFIGKAAELLRKIKGFDSRVFPWDLDQTALYTHFGKLQRAAGIHLHCPAEHEHTDSCHVYGFHDFRRSHATYNHGRAGVSDRDLQTQMGHKSFATTQRYIKYAEEHTKTTYNAHLPPSLAGSA